MSINWTKVDLLLALRTERVSYGDLSAGDIIVAGTDAPFEISSIHPDGDGMLEFLDEDKNGFTVSGDWTVERVLRSALKAFPRG